VPENIAQFIVRPQLHIMLFSSSLAPFYALYTAVAFAGQPVVAFLHRASRSRRFITEVCVDVVKGHFTKLSGQKLQSFGNLRFDASRARMSLIG